MTIDTMNGLWLYLFGVPIAAFIAPKALRILAAAAAKGATKHTRAAREAVDGEDERHHGSEADAARDVRRMFEEVLEQASISPGIAIVTYLGIALFWPAVLVLVAVFFLYPILPGRSLYVCDGCHTDLRFRGTGRRTRRRAQDAGWVFPRAGSNECYCRVCILTGRAPVGAGG